MKPAVFAAIVLISCGPRQATPDSGITPTPDAGMNEKDTGTPEPDAGSPDTGPVDAGTLGWKMVLQTPPSRSTHRAFWWAPTHDTRVLSGNHATGPIQDFWRWSGSGKWTQTPMSEDECPERKNAAVALDDVHQRLYVFGGTWSGYPRDGGAYTVRVLGDFRSWDGTAWRDETPDAGAPSLWELDGTVWRDRSLLPLPRAAAAFSQKGVNGEALLLGGYMAAGGSSLRDTWRWKEGRWSQLSGAGPDARSDATMAFHGSIALLVGGQGSGNTFSADNWAMGPGSDDWVTVSGPTPRSQAAMAHDPKPGRTVVFGGRNATGRLSDTWVFDGTGWKQLTTATVPEARKDATMLFDPTQEQLVLFGGSRTGGGVIDDAWAFDGVDWKLLPGMTAAPTPRVWQAMAYDSLGRLWTFGGHDGTTTFDDAARFGAKLLAAGNDRWQLHFGSTSDFKQNWFDHGDVWELGLR